MQTGGKKWLRREPWGTPLCNMCFPQYILTVWGLAIACLCAFEYRQCSEYTIAASRVVDDCTGNGNLCSSSFGIPLPQVGPQTSVLRHGEKNNNTHVSSVASCIQLQISQPVMNCRSFLSSYGHFTEWAKLWRISRIVKRLQILTKSVYCNDRRGFECSAWPL